MDRQNRRQKQPLLLTACLRRTEGTIMKAPAGKNVQITAGQPGIGKACAEAMLTAGAEAVVINGRSRDRGERAVGTLTDRFPEAQIALVLGDMAQVADARRGNRETWSHRCFDQLDRHQRLSNASP